MVVPPNHPILIGFSIINHPFWGTSIFGTTQMVLDILKWKSTPPPPENERMSPEKGRFQKENN